VSPKACLRCLAPRRSAAAKFLTDAHLRRELVTSVMTANTASSASMMAQHSVALLLRGAPPCDDDSEEEEEPREVLSVVAYHWQSTVATAQVRHATSVTHRRGDSSGGPPVCATAPALTRMPTADHARCDA